MRPERVRGNRAAKVKGHARRRTVEQALMGDDMKRIFPGYSRWCRQKYILDKMSLRDLNTAYFTYPAIQTYILFLVISAMSSLYFMGPITPIIVSVLCGVFVYPFVWYLLHRFVLHGRWLYRSRHTAALWKRVHYDHHQNPQDLAVLFGGLHTTLPTIFFVTFSLGWLIGGLAGALAAFATGLATTCFYEYCHCIQHLPYRPRLRFLREIKRLHLAHHYYNEQGNFGITNFICDRVMSTYYAETELVPRSETVRNLGYTGEECDRYPWVAELTGEGAPVAAKTEHARS